MSMTMLHNKPLVSVSVEYRRGFVTRRGSNSSAASENTIDLVEARTGQVAQLHHATATTVRGKLQVAARAGNHPSRAEASQCINFPARLRYTDTRRLKHHPLWTGYTYGH
jgi:hypothetical protein